MNTFIAVHTDIASDEIPTVAMFRTAKPFHEWRDDWLYARAEYYDCEPEQIENEWILVNATGTLIDEQADSKAGYHQFIDDEGDSFGSFHVYWRADGWFWIAEQPGCLPDGEPSEPFATSEAAWLNARS